MTTSVEAPGRDLARQLHRNGRHAEARDELVRALADAPRDADLLADLAMVERATGRFAEAEQAARAAVQAAPGHALAHWNLGNALYSQGRSDEALEAYRRTLSLNPRFPEGHYNLGVALEARWELDAAVLAYRAALYLRPGYQAAHTNLGLTLKKLGRLGEAEHHLRTVLELAPGLASAHLNLAHLLHHQHRFADAHRSFLKALRIAPGWTQAAYGRALAWLHQGELATGFAAFEARCDVLRLPTFGAPRWDGSPLAGKSVLVFGEQGFGDCLQFIRYAPLIAERGGVCVLHAPAELATLLARAPGVHRVVPFGAEPPAHDLEIPLMSLAFLAGTTLATVPAPVPYLSADPARVSAFERLLPPRRGLRAGLVWRGRPVPDPLRSPPPEALAPLRELAGVDWVSLHLEPGGLPLESFDDTAAVIASLDVVVSIDTAVAHLAGALGVPVLLALPLLADWRWLLDRDDSPWYPSMRLYRQTSPGEWGAVVARIAADLAASIPAN